MIGGVRQVWDKGAHGIELGNVLIAQGEHKAKRQCDGVAGDAWHRLECGGFNRLGEAGGHIEVAELSEKVGSQLPFRLVFPGVGRTNESWGKEGEELFELVKDEDRYEDG